MDAFIMKEGKKMEVKKTLLMPKTAFEMRGNLNKKEPVWLSEYKEMDLYDLMRKSRLGKKMFVLHDGPPYANGNIHVGHTLNRILKDFVIRIKHMEGYDTPFIFGWDTHGLPIEHEVTKSGVDRKSMSITDFRKLCEKYAYEQVNKQKEQIRRLGVVGDFKHPYLTLTKDYEARQLGVFKKMALDGLIFRGLKPVYWSPSSESALAEAEIEYKDVTSPAIYVKFPVVDGKNVLDKDTSFIIWTTTPWTLPANLAISLHPYFTYGLYESELGKIILLVDLADDFKNKVNVNLTLLKTFRGDELEGITTAHPLFDRVSPIILGEHVTKDAGTGAVHTAPGHGLDDYYVGMKYHLDILSPVDAMGYMTKDAHQYEGLFYSDANDVILEDLRKKNLLIYEETITHSYPHDWRTGKPVIFRATPQWFATLDPIREKLLSEIERVTWTPKWGKLRMHNMIKNRDDWCISRQRVWGVPIPIIYNEDGTPIMEEAVFDHIIDLVSKYGTNIWFEKDEKFLLPEGYTNSHSPNGKFKKEMDIMDVWFDSGSSSIAVLQGRGLPYPSDLYLEGSDQYRGWFNASLILGVAKNGKAPYNQVLTHGFVMDEDWEKMSKSKGNGIDPLKIAQVYGADILRLWVGTVQYQNDTRLSEDIIKQTSELYRKIRNTFKFMLGNLSDAGESFPLEKLDEVEVTDFIDKLMLSKLDEVIQKVIDAYDAYDFARGVSVISNFLTGEMSSFYLDITKDILYCESKDSHRRRSTQKVIYRVTSAISRLLNPILPFTMNEVYTHLNLAHKEKNIQLTDFPARPTRLNEENLALFDKFMKLRDEALVLLEKGRSNNEIGSSQEAEITLVVKDNELFNVLNALDPFELARLFIVSKVTLTRDGENKLIHSPLHKCDRCWNYRDDGEEVDGVYLCHRCLDVVNNLPKEDSDER
jgi:isoleucyl-tRNA synthetase